MAQFTLDLPIKQGTQAAYTALETKDASTLYITTDTGNLYFGDIKLTGQVDKANPIVNTTFDEETQKFTFTKLDGTTQEVDLVLESVVQSFQYDKTTHKCTVTTVSGSTTQIDLTDLIGAVSGKATTTTTTTVTDGEIGVDVKVSEDESNAIELKADGLYVNKSLTAGLDVQDTSSVDMTFTEGQLKADVKVSSETGNTVETKTDGVYVGVPKAVIGTF